MSDQVFPSRRIRRPFAHSEMGSLTNLTVMVLGMFSVHNTWAQPPEMTQPSPPQLSVRFRLTLAPDKEAQSIGAVSFSNLVQMNGVWVDEFTGAGCLPGEFESSIIDLRALPVSDDYSFEVSCGSYSKKDTASRVEWKGTLRDGKISGDVWITLPGTPLPEKDVVAQRIDRDRAKADHAMSGANGNILSEKSGDIAGYAADRKNAMLANRGRKLHFTFTTAEIELIPVGDWNPSKAPTTRPSAEVDP